MIVDDIKNSDFYLGLNEKFSKAFDFIKNSDLLSMECGKYEIDGDNIYANLQEYDTKPVDEGKWEAHKKYIDIQYVIKGQEEMGYANISEMKPICEYDESKDIVFLKGSGDFFVVKEGFFTIFTPNDAHMPSLAVVEEEYTKKVIVKIKID